MTRWPVSGSTQLVGGSAGAAAEVAVEAGALVPDPSAAKARKPASKKLNDSPVKTQSAAGMSGAIQIGLAFFRFTIYPTRRIGCVPGFIIIRAPCIIQKRKVLGRVNTDWLLALNEAFFGVQITESQ